MSQRPVIGRGFKRNLGQSMLRQPTVQTLANVSFEESPQQPIQLGDVIEEFITEEYWEDRYVIGDQQAAPNLSPSLEHELNRPRDYVYSGVYQPLPSPEPATLSPARSPPIPLSPEHDARFEHYIYPDEYYQYPNAPYNPTHYPSANPNDVFNLTLQPQQNVPQRTPNPTVETPASVSFEESLPQPIQFGDVIEEYLTDEYQRGRYGIGDQQATPNLSPSLENELNRPRDYRYSGRYQPLPSPEPATLSAARSPPIHLSPAHDARFEHYIYPDNTDEYYQYPNAPYNPTHYPSANPNDVFNLTLTGVERSQTTATRPRGRPRGSGRGRPIARPRGRGRGRGRSLGRKPWTNRKKTSTTYEQTCKTEATGMQSRDNDDDSEGEDDDDAQRKLRYTGYSSQSWLGI